MTKLFKNILTTILTLVLFMLLSKPLTQLKYVPPVPKETKSQEQLFLETMTLEQKVGQLLLFGIPGYTVDENTQNNIQNKNIGGVLILSKNIQNSEQLKQLISNLQGYADIPLFVSIDQEGGSVARLKGSTVLTKAQKDMKDENEAYSIALQRGEVLKNLGINFNLAPVVEYSTDRNSFMYDRVFRGDVNFVSNMGSASVRGYTDSNIASILKHYPGHGNTHSDSHYKLPSIPLRAEQWDEYILPFKNVLEVDNVDAVMVGHILFPNIDSNPSTISSEIVQKRLREDLGFDGLIMSDDMLMDSIQKQGENCDIAKQSLLAGIDVLIYSKALDVQNEIYKCVMEAIKSEEIPEDLLNEKVLRILRVKMKYQIIDTTLLPQK